MNSSVTLALGQSRYFHADAMLSRKGDSLHWNPFWSYKYDNEPLVALKCYAAVQLPCRLFILKMWIHFQCLKIIQHSPTGTGDKNVHVTNFGSVPGRVVVRCCFSFPKVLVELLLHFDSFSQQRILRTSTGGRLQQRRKLWSGSLPLSY